MTWPSISRFGHGRVKIECYTLFIYYRELLQKIKLNENFKRPNFNKIDKNCRSKFSLLQCRQKLEWTLLKTNLDLGQDWPMLCWHGNILGIQLNRRHQFGNVWLFWSRLHFSLGKIRESWEFGRSDRVLPHLHLYHNIITWIYIFCLLNCTWHTLHAMYTIKVHAVRNAAHRSSTQAS